jgi:hypothetical protein
MERTTTSSLAVDSTLSGSIIHKTGAAPQRTIFSEPEVQYGKGDNR